MSTRGDQPRQLPRLGAVDRSTGLPVWFGRIPHEAPLEGRDLRDELGKVDDRDLRRGTQVDRLPVFQLLKTEDDAIGSVVDVEELAGGPSRPPQDDLVAARVPSLDALPDDRRDHVARVLVEVVPRPVQVRRDHEGRIEPVLVTIGLRLHQQHLLR